MDHNFRRKSKQWSDPRSECCCDAKLISWVCCWQSLLKIELPANEGPVLMRRVFLLSAFYKKEGVIFNSMFLNYFCSVNLP